MGLASAFINRICADAKLKGYVAVEGYSKISEKRNDYDPYYHIEGQKESKIEDYLKTRIIAGSIEIKMYDSPAFIDCGSNLEK